MAAGIHKFTIEQGATWSKTMTVRAPDPEWDGPPEGAPRTPVNLIGWTARMQIRKDTRSATVDMELTTQNGRIALDGPNGKLTLRLSATETAQLTRDGVYDLELVDTAGDVIRLLRGAIALEPQVTR